MQTYAGEIVCTFDATATLATESDHRFVVDHPDSMYGSILQTDKNPLADVSQATRWKGDRWRIPNPKITNGSFGGMLA